MGATYNFSKAATVNNHGCCDAKSGQLISGSGQLHAGDVFAIPGGSQSFQSNTPAAGLGEIAAQVRMPAGEISQLRISVVTDVPATGGAADFILRQNGADTPLTCQTNGAGDCDSGAASLTIGDDDRICVKASRSLTGVGNSYFTFSFMFSPS